VRIRFTPMGRSSHKVYPARLLDLDTMSRCIIALFPFQGAFP
jgi:hypothetical protein